MHSAADLLIGRYRAADEFARRDLRGEIETQFGKSFADYVHNMIEADDLLRSNEESIRKIPMRKRQGMGR